MFRKEKKINIHCFIRTQVTDTRDKIFFLFESYHLLIFQANQSIFVVRVFDIELTYTLIINIRIDLRKTEKTHFRFYFIFVVFNIFIGEILHYRMFDRTNHKDFL